MRDFTIEANPGLDRVTVAWIEGEYRYHFIAKVDGNEIAEIVVGGLSRKAPTIYRTQLSGGRGAIAYENAGSPEFAPVIEEARRWIRTGKRATQAIAAKRAEVAERERQRTEGKARYVREALIPLLSREGRIALASVLDGPLAEAYDQIQNSAL